MTINICLMSYSFLICFILLVYQVSNNSIATKNDKWFTLMTVCNMAMIIGDLSDAIMAGKPGAFSFWFQTLIAIILYFSASGTIMYALYGWIISNIQYKTSIDDIWMRIGKVVLVTQLVLSVTMPITKIGFINPQTFMYTRGNLFFLTQICPYLLYVLGFYLLIRYRKAFKGKEIFYLSLLIIVPALAEMIQNFYVEIRAMNLCITLSLIILFTFVHAQREVDNQRVVKEILLKDKKRAEELQEQQETMSEQLIQVLSGAVEAKDLYTNGHSLRVAQYSREIMYRLGGDEKAQTEAYYIGILHDVGKIRVNDEIINKDGKLTKSEFEKIKLHTIAGYQILRDVDVIPDLADGARWHHEKYDGSGYPNGLAGEEIPLIARIIAVADSYDAMTSNRSYRKAMTQEAAREQIVQGMGSQFDPKIAQIMLDMIDDDIQYDMKQLDINKTINILLIDDDPIVHKFVAHALVNENYILTSAYSGEEGIEYLKESDFDLCLCDMEMPGMNGFEVIEWIRHNTRKLRVIFVSGNKELETIRKSESYGIRDYISKPINPVMLRESVHSVLMH